MASVLVARVPIAYKFYNPEPKLTGITMLVGRSRMSLFSVRKVKLPNLIPKFFFTDKGSGQINVIKPVFRITRSICFWYMKRAVKKKIAKMYKNSA